MDERSRMGRYFGEVVARRYSRREVLQGLAGAVPAIAFGQAAAAREEVRAKVAEWPPFQPIRATRADSIVLPPGYTYDIVVRWGDPIVAGRAALDPRRVAAGALLEPGAAAAQASQFGYNCDAIHFFATAADGSRGILCVNNEYTNDELLFPGRRKDDQRRPADFRDFVMRHPESVRYTQAAHGISVVEVERVAGHWRARSDSPMNRRITGDTPVQLTGPARGAALMRSSYDPSGVTVNGTLANCAGGRTPWGTYLSAEENIEDYFGNFAGLRARKDIPVEVLEAHRRFWLWERASLHGWEFVD
ncbi:MAG TPA: alkaline phosphatase PhoX, partial [Steroidobacteraceae bacterium]|nr:alkaline phosphatase PhoX [Steroidobacteraceae bacterium]